MGFDPASYDHSEDTDRQRSARSSTFGTVPESTEPRLVRGTLFAAVAGLIGAVIWAFISAKAQLEIGWIAWGIGGACGALMAVGVELPNVLSGAVAAALALVSVAAGKVLAVYLTIAELTGVSLTQVSGQLNPVEVLGETLSPYDALWLFLAVGTAFKLGSVQRTAAD
jgi:hypothetical protein